MSSTPCEWCDGQGCEECQVQFPSTMDALSNTAAENVIRPTVECEWCDGVGCDECSGSATGMISPTLTSAPLLNQTSLKRTASQILSPGFLQSPYSVISVNEDQVISYLSYRIHQTAQHLYTTFDDAEALLRQFLWNQDNLTKEWIQEGGQEKIRNVENHATSNTAGEAMIYSPISEDPCPHPTYLDQKTPPVKHIVDIVTVSKLNQQLVNKQREWFAQHAQMSDDTSEPDPALMECPICMLDDIPFYEMVQLQCGHSFCADCLQAHVTDAVRTTGTAALNLTCPAIEQKSTTKKALTNDNITKCNATLSFNLMFQLLQKQDQADGTASQQDLEFLTPRSPTSFRDSSIVYRTADIQSTKRVTLAGRFKRWVAEEYVRDSKAGFQACPSVHSCSLFIYYNNLMLPRPPIPVHNMPYTFTTPTNFTFICPCGTITCKCGQYGSHFLAHCDVAEKYLSCTDPEELAKKMIESTCKKCPKCAILITKDRNCNHVHCAKCGHHFCWICKGEWSKHNAAYSCSNTVEKNAMDEHLQTLTSTQEMQTISYFSSYASQYQRFIEESLNLFWTNIKNPETATEDGKRMFNAVPSFIDIIQQFYICCSILQWSYCIMIYLPPADTNARAKILVQQQAWAISQVSHFRTLLVKYLKEPLLLLDAQTYQAFDNRRKSAVLTLENFYKAIEAFNTNDMISYGNTKRASLDISDDNATGKKLLHVLSKQPPTATNWCCSLCNCLHMGAAADLIFDDFEENKDGEDLLIDITEQATASRAKKAQNAKYRGVMKNNSGKVICANCHACQIHSEPDCRLCFAR